MVVDGTGDEDSCLITALWEQILKSQLWDKELGSYFVSIRMLGIIIIQSHSDMLLFIHNLVFIVSFYCTPYASIHE